jgi:mRNA interferase RelE/StbE
MDTDCMVIVSLTEDSTEQLMRLPKPIHARVVRLLKRLEHWPDVSGAKPLRGELTGWFRMRTGDYRLRFRLHGEKVLVDKIGHRSDFYEG